jgi:hypothetical protein
MWSAMAFINSGGTLFPTRAPSAVANFPEARFLGVSPSVSGDKVHSVQSADAIRAVVHPCFVKMNRMDRCLGNGTSSRVQCRQTR